jgi:hydrogenase-4 component E
MDPWLDAVLVLLLLTDLALLGVSQLASCIRLIALQGILLAVFTLLANAEELTLRLVLIALASAGLKGVLFPWLLRRAIREAEIRREVEPFIGFVPSLVLGVLLLALATWLGHRLGAVCPAAMAGLVPAAIFTQFTGLFICVSRRKALSQAVGYLAFDNGIYVFGIAAVGEIPFLVELGMLMDAFVAVFVMGIAIFHINREFDHIDADKLNLLKG